MFLRQLDLTTALRPSLYDDETLLFVQDNVGLYEGKYKIPNYQNGQAYLTSHRVCYVDNDEPRKYSVAVDLKQVDRTEAYAGFLKSSAKITLFSKVPKHASQAIKSPLPRYASPADALIQPSGSPSRSYPSTPAPARDINATWICPICGFSNPVPPNFDPATANQHTNLPPCQACGIPPPLVHMVKAAIAAMSNRPSGPSADPAPLPQSSMENENYFNQDLAPATPPKRNGGSTVCSRCTFENHPSLTACEMCGAPLAATGDRRSQLINESVKRPESPGPTLNDSIFGNDSIETIKFSFRAGGDKVFHERLKGALVQRKWLLQSAPPVPTPMNQGHTNSTDLSNPTPGQIAPPPRIVGIAGLERRGAQLRANNQAVIGSAFEDLEALMTSAKEVIAMAEQFRAQSSSSDSLTPEARALLNDSASALGLTTTKDMLGSGATSENLYVTELARNLAEFLTDDRRGVLRREGGIISLVDLWAVFNRTRNGIELVSPADFEKAAKMWETLQLPIRLRRFKSGLLVVQERNRTDEKTIASLLAWLRESVNSAAQGTGDLRSTSQEAGFGRGITPQETAERFGWSVGVASEELEMAEDVGAICRDQCLDGIRFWENHFTRLDEAALETRAGDALGSLDITDD